MTTLERIEVMSKLLDGDDRTLSVLRKQFERAEVSNREMTGVGFYLAFAVPTDAGRVPGNLSVKFGDVHADMDGLRTGAGFLLHVKDGLLHMLEGYTYDEPWPTKVVGLRLRYTDGPNRNLEKLRSLFQNPTQPR